MDAPPGLQAQFSLVIQDNGQIEPLSPRRQRLLHADELTKESAFDAHAQTKRRVIMKHDKRKLTLIRAAIFTALAVPAATIWANSAVIVESVNVYPNGDILPFSIANGSGFMNKITEHDFTSFRNLTDSSVNDRTFIDQDITGDLFDNDEVFFDCTDKVVISYFTGHGIGGGPDGSQPCGSSSDCVAPPPGTTNPGRCSFDIRPTGFCFYPAPRAIVTNSPASSHGDVVDYTSGIVRLGESVNSGPWGGAGTDGGTNLAVLDLSFGAFRTSLQHDLAFMFAGLHLVATIMPVNGDTNNVPNRGSAFADHFLVNQFSSVAQSWNQVVHILAHDGSCAAGEGDGGGGGINGCGANVTFAADIDAAADRRMQENWVELRDEGLDGKGFTRWVATYECNYDCNKFPIVKDFP
jgi:hypothetical protein